MLPTSLPWFAYAGVVDDLGVYLEKKVPVGYCSIVLLSHKITIKSGINLASDYHHVPVDLVIVCETLVIPANVSINLAGKSAPDLVSFHDEKYGSAWQGKAGCNGGSISIYAASQVGEGKLNIDVRGGNGGKGQDGYIGKPGARGEDVPFMAAAIVGVAAHLKYNSNGKNGENGGDGGKGGKGGDAGEIEIHIHSPTDKFLSGTTTETAGGKGGRGGCGGDGGRGGPGGRSGLAFGIVTGKSGSHGKSGRDGQCGDIGQTTKPELISASDEVLFYKSIPITTAYLQRALNAEVLYTMHANLQDDKAQLHEAEDSIAWISKIAQHNGYDILQSQCSDFLKHRGKASNLFTDSRKVKTEILRSHFEELKEVATKSAGLIQRDLHSTLKNDHLLTKYARYATIFHQLDSYFSDNKAQYVSARDLARNLRNPPSMDKNTEAELETSFLKHFSDHLTIAAKSHPLLITALQEGSPSEISFDCSELLAGYEVSGAAEIGVGGAEAASAVVELFLEIAGAAIAAEVLVIALVGAAVVYGAVKCISFLLKAHAKDIAKYEEEVHARAKLEAQNQERLKYDEKKRNPPVKRHQKRRKDERKSESGKFIGMLGRCERVDGMPGKVVAEFDAIPLQFTTESGKKVDINRLDPIQQAELTVQLYFHRSPLSPLPAFLITTTLDEGDVHVNENKIGNWFEFDTRFGEGGSSDAVEIVTVFYVFSGLILWILSYSKLLVHQQIHRQAVQCVSLQLRAL